MLCHQEWKLGMQDTQIQLITLLVIKLDESHPVFFLWLKTPHQHDVSFTLTEIHAYSLQF